MSSRKAGTRWSGCGRQSALLVVVATLLCSAAARAVELQPGDILVADGRRLLRVDPQTGARVVLSDATTGMGPAFGSITGLAVAGGGRLFIADGLLDVVFEVEPATGDRSIVSSGTVILGPFTYPNTLVAVRDAAVGPDGDLFVLTHETGCSGQGFCFPETFGVQRIDLASGDGTLLAGKHANLILGNARPSYFMAVEASGGIVTAFYGQCETPFIPFGSNGGVAWVDPASSDGGVLSGGGDAFSTPVGAGPPLGCEFSSTVAVAPNGDILVREASQLLRVDPVTGDRLAVAPFDGGDMEADAAGNVVYLENGAVFRLALASGNVTLVSDLSAGPDPLLPGAFHLHVVPEPTIETAGAVALAALTALRARRSARSRARPGSVLSPPA